MTHLTHLGVNPLARLSISDDDLCSNCRRCHYPPPPHELSTCDAGWPGMQDSDGYIQKCDHFKEVGHEHH